MVIMMAKPFIGGTGEGFGEVWKFNWYRMKQYQNIPMSMVTSPHLERERENPNHIFTQRNERLVAYKEQIFFSIADVCICFAW